MKKAKTTPVSLPGTNSKVAPPKSWQKPPLSSEFVDSSGDSAVEETPPPKTKEKSPKHKSPVKIAVHRPKTNGVAKKTKVPLPKQKSAPKKVSNEEPDTSSSSSDESDDERRKTKHAPGVNGADKPGKDAVESVSGSDSSSSDSEEAAPTPAQNSTKEKPRPKPRPPQSHTVEFLPAQPFVPPKGFTEVPTLLPPSSQVVKMFENLEGKQIWHITAPAGVSVSQLKEFALDQAMGGNALLSHKGTDYGFTVEELDQQTSRQVLIPRQNGFKAVSTKITQTLHLQQVLRLPKLTSKQAGQNTGSAAAASITRSTIRAPRPQVKGLRMRYFHSGFGDQDPGTLGSSESESERPAPAGLGIPNGTQGLSKPEKRKHDEIIGVETAASPAKKHKKHRTPEEIRRKEEKKARKERKRENERVNS